MKRYCVKSKLYFKAKLYNGSAIGTLYKNDSLTDQQLYNDSAIGTLYKNDSLTDQQLNKFNV